MNQNNTEQTKATQAEIDAINYMTINRPRRQSYYERIEKQRGRFLLFIGVGAALGWFLTTDIMGVFICMAVLALLSALPETDEETKERERHENPTTHF